MDRMGVQPILPVKMSVTFDTILTFDGDFDVHGYGDVTCKRTLNFDSLVFLFILDRRVNFGDA